MKVTTIILALAVGLIFGVAINNAATQSASEQVYAVCQQSRLSPTIDERGCADLQDQLHVEYLCDHNNNLESNHCWTETK